MYRIIIFLMSYNLQAGDLLDGLGTYRENAKIVQKTFIKENRAIKRAAKKNYNKSHYKIRKQQAQKDKRIERKSQDKQQLDKFKSFVNKFILYKKESTKDKYKIEVLYFKDTRKQDFVKKNWPISTGEVNTTNIEKNILQSTKHTSLFYDYQNIANKKYTKFISEYSYTQELIDSDNNPVIIKSNDNNNKIISSLAIKRKNNRHKIYIELDYEQNIIENPNRVFHLSHEVSVKNNNPLFLDHPLVGMMIKINKI